MREDHLVVLGINGSPRDGNSPFLLKEALQASRGNRPGRKSKLRGIPSGERNLIPAWAVSDVSKINLGVERVIKDDFLITLA